MKIKLRDRRFPTLVAVVAALVGLAASVSLLSGRAAAAACQQPSTDYGSVSTSVNLPAAATYRIWSRINVPDSTNNTYLLQVQNGSATTCYTVGGGSIPANTWVWVASQGSTKIDVSLQAGSHSLKMIGNKPNVKIDRVVFSSDLACVPQSSGDNCNVPSDTTAPIARITAPAADASVSGAVTVSATASDNVGVSKVEFYVNGMLANTDVSVPYSFSWDTTSLPNGTTQALSVRAYDAAGNIGNDNIRVTLQNGDRQAPTTPASLKATATAYNAVSLSWKASTDDTKVQGYHIFRDGVPLADAGAVTSYNDTTVSAGTSYSYKISAFDAAGNVSAVSTAVTVKTPTIADSQAPTAPAELSAAAVSTTQVNLAWKASTDNVGVNGYDVYRATGSATAAKIGTSATADFADTNLTPGTSYKYYVIAKDAVGNASPQSNTASVATPTPPPVNQPKAAIVGSISRQDNGNGIPHASVIFTDGGHRHIFQANRHGAYAIRDLEAGRYNLIFRARGFFSKTLSVKAEAPATTQNVSLQKR